ncbi:hypothetical protein [Prochlorococcus sp. MIT 1227]|uniref:hypothetical protein n=1 Tax=Prochlorococcus sp. MIT 1227 TaxID=3082536 RepID=UPI0039A5282A
MAPAFISSDKSSRANFWRNTDLIANLHPNNRKVHEQRRRLQLTRRFSTLRALSCPSANLQILLGQARRES